MFELTFHPDTSLEIKSSYDWYQLQANGLGDDFVSELESAFETIASMPETWPKFGISFHRFLLSKFPFSIIYEINHDIVHVLAIMHNSKRPGYWHRRT